MISVKNKSIMLSVVMLSVIMLSLVMLSVGMLNVVEPENLLKYFNARFHHLSLGIG
jgi:hypothetical protein